LKAILLQLRLSQMACQNSAAVRIVLCAFAFVASHLPTQAQLFTAGDLVVTAYGNVGSDGTNRVYLDGNPTPISLLEFSPTAAANTMPLLIFTLPVANSGANLGIVGEYGSSSEGNIQLSGNGQYLTFAGYSAIPALAGTGAGGNGIYQYPSVTKGDTALAQSKSSKVPRVAVLVDANGYVNSSASFNNLFSTDNPRSVYSQAGQTLYISGEGSGSLDQGVYYATVGSTNTSTAIYDKEETRFVTVYNGNLYFSADKGGGKTGIFEFDGVPTSKASATQIIPANNGNGVNFSPEGFYFASATTLYLADTGDPKAGGTSDGGVQKWVYNGSTWALAYTLRNPNFVPPSEATSASSGETGFEAITGSVTGSGPSAVVNLYAVSYTAGDDNPNGLYAITDTVDATSSSASFTELESSKSLGDDVVLKGVSFAPTPSSSATVSLSNLVGPYSGSPQAVTVTTNPANLSVSVTYNGSTSPPTAVGNYAVVATINQSPYQGSALGTLVIGKGSATVTLGSLAATYDVVAQSATATTNPTGLGVTFTYNGSSTPPTAAGSYAVVGTINDPTYMGNAKGTLVIAKASATVTLGNLTAAYTGRPISATATTVPPKLPVTLTYDNSPDAPTAIGMYAVNATINSADYTGTATGTLTITPPPPTATTDAASAITTTTATLNGVANPKGSDTAVTFQYGTSAADYTYTTAGQDIGTGSSNVSVSAPITELAVGAEYHYRVVASSAGGIVNGADRTFLTLGPNFSAPGQAYVAVSGTQLSFSINPEGKATTVQFVYWNSADPGSPIDLTPQSIGAGRALVNASTFLSGLTPNTSYSYEVIITNAAGTFTTPVETFTTLNYGLTLVAATGTLATGTASNFATLGSGAVDSSDGAAFRATLATSTALGVTTANNAGIWANVANSDMLTRVARTGTFSPDANGNATTALFATLTDPVYNKNGDVAFGGTLKVATGVVTAANESGVWASNSGTLSLLAREGFPAPGITTTGTSTAMFAKFGAVGLSDDAGALVAATLATSATTGVTAANDSGVWEGSTPNSLTLMLRAGEATDTGKTIESFTFLPTETYVNGQTRGFAPARGYLAATATYTDKTTGIIKVTAPATPLAVVTKGDSANDGGATFSTFGSPAINDSDDVAFAATLTGATKTTASGIWVDSGTDLGGGMPELVARTGSPSPDAGGVTIGPTFLTLGDPVLNANDAMAFRGTLTVGSGEATAATASGLWCDSTGVLSLVARQGAQAPGCATGVVFSGFTELALDDVNGATQQGGVIFLATLSGTGATAANNTAIFSQDSSGTLQLIVRTGDVLNGKTITALSFLPAEAATNALVAGQGRSVSSASGDLLYNATFSDKSQAIFNVVFP
jgi:hypothetical protein